MAVKYWEGKTALYEFEYDGGEHSPIAGETINVDGEEGDETAVIQAWSITGGAWATNDAAGKMWVYSCSATFLAQLADNDVLEDSGGTKICDVTAVIIPPTAKEGDWQCAGNWGTGEDPAVPLADDEVIFDGRSTHTPSEGMLDSESGAAAQCTFDLLHFKSSWAGGVAGAAEPLICAPDRIQIDGTGTYYICCGKDSQITAADIDTCIVNNKDAIVYLYSNCNNGAQAAVWTDIHVIAVDTLYLKYYTVDAVDCGLAYTYLFISPTGNQHSKAIVYIEKDAYTIGGSTPNVIMRNGTLYADAQIGIFYKIDGTVYYGTDLGTSPETALDITFMLQWGGTTYWQPDDSGDDAFIKEAYIYGGTLNASGTTNADRAKVLGGGAGYDIHLFPGATINLANGRGNITLAANSKLLNHGGTLTLDSGTSIGVTYDV
jgi:hypothetical protein